VREESTGRWTWPASTALFAGYLALAAATTAAVAVGGTHRPGMALGLISVTALAVATRAAVPVAPAIGAMGWLFYAGFITGRHAQLAWHGAADIKRLGILMGVAFCGAADTWLHARARTRRPRSADRALVRLAPVASLADARAARRGRPASTVPATAEPRQLIGLLDLRECRFEYGMLLGQPPRLEPDGRVRTRYGHWPVDEVGLPDQELELRTFSNGQYCGRFMMTPKPGSMPPLQARLVAAWPRRRHLLLSLIQFENVWLDQALPGAC